MAAIRKHGYEEPTPIQCQAMRPFAPHADPSPPHHSPPGRATQQPQLRAAAAS